MDLKQLSSALKTLQPFIKDLTSISYTQCRFVAAERSIEINNGAQAGRVTITTDVPDLAVPASLLKDLLRGEEGKLEFTSDGIQWQTTNSKGLIRPSPATALPPLMSTLKWNDGVDMQHIPLPRRIFDGIGWIADRPASPLHPGIILSTYGDDNDLAMSVVSGSQVYCIIFPGIVGPATPVVLPDVLLTALTTITTDVTLGIEPSKVRVVSADNTVQLASSTLPVPSLDGFLSMLKRFDLGAVQLEVPEDFRVFLRRCHDVLSYGNKDARLTMSPDGMMVSCVCDASVAKLTTVLIPPASLIDKAIEVGVEGLYKEFGSPASHWADYLGVLGSTSNMPLVQCMTPTDFYLKLGILAAVQAK